MNAAWKFGIGLGWTILAFAAGCDVATKFDEAAQAKVLQTQIAANQQAIREANDHAAELERSLAAERLRESSINQQMEAALAHVPDCPVPDDVVRVLNDAIADRDHTAR